MGTKLVLIVEVRDSSFLNGMRRRMPALIHRALQYAGLGLALERLYEVTSAGSADVCSTAESVSADLSRQIQLEEQSLRRVNPPPMH